MAVRPSHHGRGLGERLGHAVIDTRVASGAHGMSRDQRRLRHAIRLYERLGFVHVVRPAPSVYARSDIYMELDLRYEGQAASVGVELFEKRMIATWGDIDYNGHMRNTAFLDKSADLRLMFFTERGMIVIRQHSGRSCGKTSSSTSKRNPAVREMRVTLTGPASQTMAAGSAAQRILARRRNARGARDQFRRLARSRRAQAGGAARGAADRPARIQRTDDFQRLPSLRSAGLRTPRPADATHLKRRTPQLLRVAAAVLGDSRGDAYATV